MENVTLEKKLLNHYVFQHLLSLLTRIQLPITSFSTRKPGFLGYQNQIDSFMNLSRYPKPINMIYFRMES
jgi:hypothetical protein